MNKASHKLKKGSSLISAREAFRKGISIGKEYQDVFNVVAQINNVAYINHGESQSVSETFEALQKIQHPVTLIIGGLNGLENYSLLTGHINQRITNVIVFGIAKDQLAKKFEAYDVNLHVADSIQDGVAIAHLVAESMSVVLFSPASQPLEFKSLEHRIETFNKSVSI